MDLVCDSDLDYMINDAFAWGRIHVRSRICLLVVLLVLRGIVPHLVSPDVGGIPTCIYRLRM